MRRKVKRIKAAGSRTGRVIGSFSSIKTRKAIPFRSSLERDLLYLLELNPAVKSYTCDTPTVLCTVDGAYLQFRCDFELGEGDAREQLLIARAGHSPNLYQALQRAYGKEGLRFTVISEADVRTGAHLSNSKLLYKYARQVVCTNANIALNRFFSNRVESTIGQLQGFLGANGVNRMTAYTFLYLNYIQFTVTEHLQEGTTIWPAGMAMPVTMEERS